MFSAWVVEAVDVFRCPAMVCLQTMRGEEGDFDLAAGLPGSAPDQFCLQRLEEAFDRGIVVTIALSTHRYLEPVVAQKLLIIVRAVLRPAVRVMDATRWRSSDRDGHVQGTQSEILLHAVADGPSDHAS